MYRLIDVLKALTTFSWFVLSIVLLFGSFLEIHYASAVQDLANANSKSIMLMRSVIDQHYAQCYGDTSSK